MNHSEINEFSGNYNRGEWVPMNAHDYFLTYSRCPISKNNITDMLKRKFIKYYKGYKNEFNFSVTAHELHEQEHESGIMDHLHLYLRFVNKQYVKVPTFFDIKYKDNNYHPQIGTVTNPIGCMKYTIGLVPKKGNKIGDIHSIGIDPIKFIKNSTGLNTPTSNKSTKLEDMDEAINKNTEKKNNNKKKKQMLMDDTFRKLINREITLYEAIDIVPTLISKYISLKKNIDQYWTDKKNNIGMPKKLNKFDIHNLNCEFTGNFKEPQFWICGKPDTGKTTFIRNLKAQGYTFYQIPKNNDHRKYNDNTYSAAYIDEFNKGHLTYEFINEWMQGSTMQLNYKGASTEKSDHFPTFILSNYFPWEVYNKNDMIKNTILARMKIIYTDIIDGQYTATEIWNPSWRNDGKAYPPQESTVLNYTYDWNLTDTNNATLTPKTDEEQNEEIKVSMNQINEITNFVENNIIRVRHNTYFQRIIKAKQKRYKMNSIKYEKVTKEIKYIYASDDGEEIERTVNWFVLKTDLSKSNVPISEYIVYMYNKANIRIDTYR